MRANKPSTSQPPGAMVTPAENGFRPRIDASAGDDADMSISEPPKATRMLLTAFAAMSLRGSTTASSISSLSLSLLASIFEATRSS